MCWIHLRSISHNIDSNEKYHSLSSHGFIQKLAYCLYLPTLFLGPLTLYHEFMDSVCRFFQNVARSRNFMKSSATNVLISFRSMDHITTGRGRSCEHSR